MRKSVAVVLFAIVLGSVTPALGAELTGTALGCFPDPNYPGPRPPQCIESTGLSMYTETGGPNRDLFYHGSTFDQVGSGSYTLDLGTLTLVGAGIRSTINDVLHLSVNVADQHGEVGIANYIVSASGFAFYDSMRRQSVGQVSLNFGDPEPTIFNTAFGSYSMVLNVPPTPVLLTIPAGTSNGSVSYDITANLSSLHSSQLATHELIATPEPGTVPLVALSSVFLGIGLLRRTRRENQISAASVL